MKPYDQVRVTAIRDDRFAEQPVFYDRQGKRANFSIRC